jgi:hypothetical protein
MKGCSILILAKNGEFTDSRVLPIATFSPISPAVATYFFILALIDTLQMTC